MIQTAVGSSNPFGLVNGHAYSLLGAYVVNDTGVISKLYKIRNPWSQDVYNGKWNDSDTASWTPAAISQTGFVKNLGDGVFWIDYRDFVRAFSSYSIGYINDKYVHSTVEAVDTLTLQSFNFTVPTSQSAYVMVDFYNWRMYPSTCRTVASSGYLNLYDSTGKAVISNLRVTDSLYG